MRIIVAGSRTFNDYDFLCKELDRLTKKLDKKKLVILSGGCPPRPNNGPKGADRLGEEWCHSRMVNYEVYKADWVCNGKLDKGAGFKRNEIMAKKADTLIAFWDEKSPGTRDMVNRAKKHGLKVRIIKICQGKDSVSTPTKKRKE